MFGRYSTMSSLSNLFTNVAGDTILQFLKEINLYTKYSYIAYVVNIYIFF